MSDRCRRLNGMMMCFPGGTFSVGRHDKNVDHSIPCVDDNPEYH